MIKRLFNLLFGWVNSILRFAESKNPEVLLNLEREKLRHKQVESFQQLSRLAGEVEALEQKNKEEDKELASLNKKITSLVKKGRESEALELSKEAAKIKERNLVTEQSLEEFSERYQELKEATDSYLEEARRHLDELQLDIEESKRAENLAEFDLMSSGILAKIGGSNDSLNRIKERIEERKKAAKGNARVAREHKRAKVESKTKTIIENSDAEDYLENLKREKGLETSKGLTEEQRNKIDNLKQNNKQHLATS